MTMHPALTEGNTAVITGGADGIGLAAATRYRSLGMNVCLADVDADKLAQAAAALGDVLTVTCDVSDYAQVEALRDAVLGRYGQVDVLMNNAGVARQCSSWTDIDAWRTTLEVNLFGVIHGVQAFTGTMVGQGTPGLIINTGSKQGITTPPGNPAYNVTKAGVKALTEALQHELRNTDDCRVSAHLLVPGFTYTGMVRRFLPEKPDSAWTAEQVIDYLLAALSAGDFYIICPDNDVTRAIDNKRMSWAMGDLVENRPPLSRWHPDFQGAFEAFMAADD